MGGRKIGTDKFDLIVIGTGSSGISAAEAALEAGAKKVAVIEKRKRLGGECPNRGCIPTKAILRSAQVLSLARRAKEFGLRIPSPGFSFSEIMKRKTAVVDRSTGGKRIEKILDGMGITLIKGSAKFTGPRELEVAGKKYRAGKIVISTGSEAFIPPIDGLKKINFMTSDTIWDLKKQPKSMVIIGGGPIGVEFAEFFSTIGTKVTIVEFMPSLLSREDEDISSIVQESFQSRGVGVMTETKVVKVEKNGKLINISVESAVDGKRKKLSAESLLVAAGKRPTIGKLDLDKAGVELDKKGRVVLNSYLQTTNPDIFVAGDAASQMLFTHVAHYHGQIVGENAIKGNRKKVNLSVVPRGTFCTPEVGSVGLTEREAREKGYNVAIGVAPYAGLGKSSVMEEREGIFKIVVNKKTGKILGGHICGHSAADLVHEIALAMQAGIKINKIADMIHAFPTFAEGIGAAAYNVE